jgi:hypothetical protein
MMTRKRETKEKQRADIDLTREQARYEIAAQFVIDLYAVERLPEFVTNAVMDALLKASALKGINIWEPDGEEFSLRALVNLFALTPMLRLEPSPDSREALAAHIAGVLNHPLCPVNLYDAIGDEVATLSRELDHDAPDHIRRVLEAVATKESEAAH